MTGSTRSAASGSVIEVFVAFLKLGLTAFGGPIAHLGYFRDEFVDRRGWIDDRGYAELIGLCQFLPGPASSQAGFAIGIMRAGPLGGLAAWCGFTLPSALIMMLFASVSASMDGPAGRAAIHGLKLVAVAIVAQALWGMARTLTPDARRIAIATLAGLLVMLVGNAWAQISAILFGMAAGMLLCRSTATPHISLGRFGISRRAALACLILATSMLGALPILAGVSDWRPLQLFDLFYRAGALVFGGGHVVLPLLREGLVPDWISQNAFLSGYGAAQALPGPLFAISAYLGVAADGFRGAMIALAAIFMPGLLLVSGALPFWARLAANPRATAVVAGANAAVVGILAAALYDPLWTAGVETWLDSILVLLGFIALVRWRLPPLLAVIAFVLIAIISRAWSV
ncbi:chromate efflux transporter [Sphingomonas sp. KC8]|uniref:chromate efflux transporter n=1 Tax=Sphingomonas sp. KC8 TaxID=1030157 RepID=UPI0002489414|nr:chromate efflux transporter [Sphingomonas sp. KC8]ARS26454.1 chromate transporter [Sphingomonas sp. KC8]